MSDLTGYKQHLVAISPLLGAAPSPGAPPALVPVDEAADQKLWLLEDTWILESPLALSPDAAARHLPNSLFDIGDVDFNDNGKDDGLFVLPITPSPLLHGSLWSQKRAPGNWNGSDLYWGAGGEKALSHDFQEASVIGDWERNTEKTWGVQEVAYQNTCWDQVQEGYPENASWDYWNHNEASLWSSRLPDAPSWANGRHFPTPPDANDAWGTQASAQRWNRGERQAGPETPEKPVKPVKGQLQKQVGGDRAIKEEEGTHAERSGACAAFELSGTETTVMLRNIPNKYSRDMLVEQLSHKYKGMFDFMYLPIDFKNKCNVGYGFVNFRTAELCSQFVQSFNGVDVRKCLPGFNSRKVVEVTPARVQGLQDNVRRLRNSPVMSQLKDHPDWLPLLFDEDGIEQRFPEPDHPLPPVRVRGSGRLKDMQR